jgi:hypothetical protein
MDDVKYVIGVDDTDIVKTMLNHKKLMKEIAAVDKQYKFLDKQSIRVSSVFLTMLKLFSK